jgi:2-polyprenyl-6-hydroxyphenyl methylase/3-demethylubiquinone-9 3-methyltransferase
MLRNNLKFYDQQAPHWWSEAATIFPLSKLNPLRFQYFDRHVSNWGGLRVLDVGCGGGYTCEFLAKRGAIVSGIDPSAACIEAAQAHAAASALTISYHIGVGEKLPFAAEQFDAVVCVDVLEHVQNPSATVAEISRVLKPGGVFCFDTINRTWESRWLMIWLLEDMLRLIPHGIHDWRKFLPPETLSQWLEQANFSGILMQGFDLFGRHPLAQMANFYHFQKTGEFRVRFDDNTQVMYIGLAWKGKN